MMHRPDGHLPFLGGLPCDQIFGFHFRVVGREGELVLGVPPDLSVEVLDKVGGIDNLLYLQGELEEHGKFVPVLPPALDCIGICLPFIGGALQGSFSLGALYFVTCPYTVRHIQGRIWPFLKNRKEREWSRFSS